MDAKESLSCCGLQNFVSWFQGMTLLFTEAELAIIIHEFISAVPYSDKKQLNQAKLNVLKEIVHSRLFLHEGTSSPVGL